MEIIKKNLWVLSLLILVLILGACSSTNQASNSNDKSGGDTKTQETKKPKSEFPKKDIEFIVGYNAGGGYSDYAQGLAPFIEKYLPNDVNVLVRNMPGAGSVTATNYIQNAKPDGYTIGIYNVNGLAPTQISQKVGYDLSKVAWLGRVSTDNNVALVKKDGKYNSIEDFKKGEKYVVATKGLQSQDTISGAITLSELGLDWEPLNHKGTGEAALSVIRGDADIMWGSYESVQQYIDSGDLKPIIFYNTEPSPDFPDAPIPTDLGLSPEINEGFNSQRLIGATPGIPDDVKKILEDAVSQAIQDPDFQAKMKEMKRSVSFADAEKSAKAVDNALNGFKKFKSVVDELYQKK